MLSPYLLENRHIAVKHCRHGIFMFSRNDNFVGRGLDLYGEWCDFEIQLLRNHIKFGDTVIDVGANIGTHAVAFGNMVGPMGAVHALRCKPILYIENNESESSKRIADALAPLNYVAYWSIHPYYDPRNYYANTVNVWPEVVWAANLICAPRQSSVTFPGAEKFLGEGDDWRACVMRMQKRQAG
jgi:hypothetical protein